MVEFSIKVRAAAKVNKIEGWQQDAEGKSFLKISIKQVPEEGKANKAIIKFLSKALGLPQSAFVIIKGHSSTSKVISIDSCAKFDFLEANRIN